MDALGAGDAILLARHGVVGVGASLAAALATCVAVERRASVSDFTQVPDGEAHTYE